MSRVSASGASIPAPRSRVADRRPQPVGRRPQLGPVVHRQRGDPRRPRPAGHVRSDRPETGCGRPPRLRRRPDRMRHRILPPQQVAREDLAIRAIAVAAVAPQPLLAPPGVLRRQPVPRQPGIGVVHRMEVVVEEQDRQRPAILDDHAARRRRARAPDARGRCGSAGSRAPASSRGDTARPASPRPAPATAPPAPAPARCSAQASATARSPARSALRSSRQSRNIPTNGPIAMRPSSVLFAASISRTGRRSRDQTAGSR